MPWYALYTKPRHEKKVYSLLKDKKYDLFLPLISRMRQWKDRKKKVELPLFTSYLFVNFDYKYRFDVLETEGVVKIVNFCGTPAEVPEWQINSLRNMLNFPETLRLEQDINKAVDSLLKIKNRINKIIYGLKITVYDGDNQKGFPGNPLPKELIAKVIFEEKKNDQLNHYPVVDMPVHFSFDTFSLASGSVFVSITGLQANPCTGPVGVSLDQVIAFQ